MNKEIKERKEIRIYYYITCYICNPSKEIRGDSKKAAKHNYDVHIDSHKRKVKSHIKKTKGDK